MYMQCTLDPPGCGIRFDIPRNPTDVGNALFKYGTQTRPCSSDSAAVTSLKLPAPDADSN